MRGSRGAISQRLRFLGTVAALAVAIICSPLGSHKVSADPLHPSLFINQHPASISTSSTATFVFFSFGDPTECQLDGSDYEPCDSPYNSPRLEDGPHIFKVRVIGSTVPEGVSTYNWTTYTTPLFVGGSAVGGKANSPIAASDLQIAGVSDDPLTVKLTVAGGLLKMGTTTGLTFTGGTNGSTLKFSGSRTHLNAALATLTYTPSSAGNKTINAYIEGANGERYNTVDGRVFQVVDSGGLNWADSKAAAEASIYGGAHGYLANIMNLDQANFITERIVDRSWLGGSDAGSEGDWRWAGGPEANMPFWSGGVGGTAVGAAYANWAGGMPDNYNGNENCLENYPGTPITWNDQDCSQARSYYVVEYGDGATIPYIDSHQIIVKVAAASASNGVSTPTLKATPSGGATGSNDITIADVASDDTANATTQTQDINSTSKTDNISKAKTDIMPEAANHIVLYVSLTLFIGLSLFFVFFFLRKRRQHSDSPG